MTAGVPRSTSWPSPTGGARSSPSTPACARATIRAPPGTRGGGRATVCSRSIPSRRSTAAGRAAFGGLPYHRYDPAARVTADVVPTAAAELEIATSTGTPYRFRRFGIARFALAGDRPRAAALLARGLRRRPVPAVRRRDERRHDVRRRALPARHRQGRRPRQRRGPARARLQLRLQPVVRRTTRRGRARWPPLANRLAVEVRAGERVSPAEPGAAEPRILAPCRSTDWPTTCRSCATRCSWRRSTGGSTPPRRHRARSARWRASATVVATFDPDAVFDYRSRRPVLDVQDGRLSELRWPELTIRHARARPSRPPHLLRCRARPALAGARGRRRRARAAPGRHAVGQPRRRPRRGRAHPPGAGDGDRLPGGAARPGEAPGPEGLLRVPSAALSVLEMAVTEAGTPARRLLRAGAALRQHRLRGGEHRADRPARPAPRRLARRRGAARRRAPAARPLRRRGRRRRDAARDGRRGSSRRGRHREPSSCRRATSSPARSSGSCAGGRRRRDARRRDVTAGTRKPAPVTLRRHGRRRAAARPRRVRSARRPGARRSATSRPPRGPRSASPAGIVNCHRDLIGERHVDGRIRVWDSISSTVRIRPSTPTAAAPGT